MGNPIKKLIFDYQLNKCHRQYEEKLARLSDPYGMWIREIETPEKCGQAGQDSKNGSINPGDENVVSHAENKVCVKDFGSYLMLTVGEGCAETPYGKYEKLFEEDSSCAFAYADEDILDVDANKRFGAFMKPDFSPDTLLSFFYFGSQIFLSKTHLTAAMEAYTTAFENHKEGFEKPEIVDGIPATKEFLYEFMLFFTEYVKKNSLHAEHIPQVLFHAAGSDWEAENPKMPEVVNPKAYWGYEPEYDDCKLRAMARRGINGTMILDDNYSRPVFEVEGTPLVSIVIPSKDHVEVLTTCIDSIYEKTSYSNFEIILVDNGSSAKNRSRIEALQEKYGFQYIYQPMDFNFSKMCNLGVAHANGEYILLLNDDMEILQKDWLTVMLGQAAQSHVGAVGAKLLYPGTDRIQHAGITNLWVGPAHKLLKESDSVDYYYGRNRLTYDMIGVTAACLLVSKEKYQKVGGFCEEIAVAYNDVDFCFSLYDQGYYNVIRNDVVLYHHESISRGDDAMSDEKWDRLLHEKDYVYQRHASLAGKDPFYNPNLAGFKHKYFCSYLYPYEQRLAKNEVKPFKKQIMPEWHNNCLTETIEHIRLERKLNLTDEVDVFWIEGWAYVLGMDSSRYSRELILTDEKGQSFSVMPFDRYRPDVVEILPQQVNVALSGFSARIRKQDLAPGTYKVAILYSDRCSRQKLYKECEAVLEI